MMQRAWILALVLCSACSKQTRAGDSSEMWADRFPAYPGATVAGKQHVTGGAMHILCTAYTTSARPEEVVSFYASRFGDTKPESPRTITVRATNEYVLVVRAVEDEGGPRCGATVRAGEKTIIVVSQAVK